MPGGAANLAGMVPDDLDPDIRLFQRRLSAGYAEHPPLDSVDVTQARAIVEAVRAPLARGGPVMAVSRDIEVPVPGLPALRLRIHQPERCATLPALVYLHGGGWVYFSLDTHDRLMREYAARAGRVVIGVDYARAPEARFPVALDQTVASLRWLRANAADVGIDAARIAAAGDSVGANLALAAAMVLRDAGEGNTLQGLVLNYGAYGDDDDGESFMQFDGPGYTLTRDEMRGFWQVYVRSDADRDDPLAQPLRGRLDGLPPLPAGGGRVRRAARRQPAAGRAAVGRGRKRRTEALCRRHPQLSGGHVVRRVEPACARRQRGLAAGVGRSRAMMLVRAGAALLLGLLLALRAAAQDTPLPDLWLEDGASEATRSWVAARNAETENRLLRDPRFAAEQRRFIALGRLGHSDEYLNGGLLHRVAVDARHPLGTWQVRAITPAAQRWLGTRGWRTLLSLDDLSRREGKPWKFRPGWLNPMCDTTIGPRCVLHLSPDGGDRTVLREFDLRTRRFVEGGFRIDAPARTYAHWVDADHLLLASDFGPGTLSSAGYARQSRLWQRGTPHGEARLLFEAADDAVLYIPHAFRSTRGPFFVAEVWRQAGGAPEWWQLRTEGPAQRLTLPVDLVRYHGVMGIAADRLVLMTAQPLTQAGTTWPAGSLLAAPLPDDTGKTGTPELIFAPAADEAVDPIFHLAIADDGLWFGVMKNVSGQLFSARRSATGWVRRSHAVPAFGAVRLLSGEVAPSSVLVKTEALLSPPAVTVRSDHAATLSVAQAPAAFDARASRTEQRFATSRDGTRVPYYIVRRKDHRFDGRAAALLTAYGGFGISFLPSYLNREFQSDFVWPMLASGGIHVHVNIRGGGEFGPAWHRAAQGREHPRGIEDLIAVAEDLVRSGAAGAQRLGFVGSSNGGLLGTAAAVMRPDLFKAVVADVPITDMLRFHELFTGAVWIDEYGDPRVPEDRAVLRSYSPLHNLREGVRYPEMLLTTSSSDDRVHPGHARRFAEGLRRLDQPVLFYESADAGHEGAASLASSARLRAMKSTYLLQALGLNPR